MEGPHLAGDLHIRLEHKSTPLYRCPGLHAEARHRLSETLSLRVVPVCARWPPVLEAAEELANEIIDDCERLEGRPNCAE